MDRLRHLIAALLLFAAGCKDDPAEKQPSPGRYAAVKSGGGGKSASTLFCEKSFPATGEGARRFTDPPERPVPGRAAPAPADPSAKRWTWVNLWASWCGPCVKEMPLLARWRAALEKEGIPVDLELWSIDEAEDDLAGAMKKGLPGHVRWLRGPDDLPAFLESLGVDRTSAIPIHALVDPAGRLRCVRVGSVGEEAYGAVKSLLSSGQ